MIACVWGGAGVLKYRGVGIRKVHLSESFRDRTQETFRLKGLHDVSIRALLLAPELVAFLSFRRAEHDRHGLEPVVILQASAGLKAVSAADDHIHDDQDGLLAGALRLLLVGALVG